MKAVKGVKANPAYVSRMGFRIPSEEIADPAGSYLIDFHIHQQTFATCELALHGSDSPAAPALTCQLDRNPGCEAAAILF